MSVQRWCEVMGLVAIAGMLSVIWWPAATGYVMMALLLVVWAAMVWMVVRVGRYQ